jgi:hypothetical protein
VLTHLFGIHFINRFYADKLSTLYIYKEQHTSLPASHPGTGAINT